MLPLPDIRSKLPNVGTTIFTVMSALAQQHGAINLSQGFPDFDTQPDLIAAVAEAMAKGLNQYAPMPGLLQLRELLAHKMMAAYNIQINPETEITITAGATQALFTAIAALVHPGDEVIVFEPAYDSYIPAIVAQGGIPVIINLHAPDFSIPWADVKRLITARTKLIIINNPHNPLGSVLSKADMQALIALLPFFQGFILSDEVYEHIVFDNQVHESVLDYPELAQRSIAVYSFGKTLHVTGWKLGYAVAPSYLMHEFRKLHQFNVFSANTAMQAGIATFLSINRDYLNLSSFFQAKRDYFLNGLLQTPFKFLPAKGSYFQVVDYSAISKENDLTFAKNLVWQHGVACIPLSPFYSNPPKGMHFVRFCFAKKETTLQAALEKLWKI